MTFLIYSEEKLKIYDAETLNEVNHRLRVREKPGVKASVRDLFPSDIGFKKESWKIDVSNCHINDYNTILDKSGKDGSINIIYAFRIRGNEYPVSAIKIRRYRYDLKEFEETEWYTEHLIDREYYILDRPLIKSFYDKIKGSKGERKPPA